MRCRSCGTELKTPFLSLGNAPFSNSFLTEEQVVEPEVYYPLDVFFCSNCYLVQIDEFEPPQKIFSSDYAYFSSYSDTWLSHCKAYRDMIIPRLGLDKRSFVIEVASNDGYLLQYFKELDIPVLGIEPALNAAEVARKKDIPTETFFFNSETAACLATKGVRGSLIIGNNVLAHNPDLKDFVEGIRIALKDDGTATMEFPHVLMLLKQNQFDTIYHEHFSYFSLHSVKRLFQSHGLDIFDVEELQTHGGSLRVYARHSTDASRPITPNVRAVLDKEEEEGLTGESVYREFAERVELTKRRLLAFLIAARNEGKKVVGYGAPAKGNTLLNYCGIRTDFLEYTVDRSPYKQGMYLPGNHIPVKHPDALKKGRPDYVLVLPWNIADEIVAQHAYIREWGGKFVIPIPETRVLE